MRSKKCTIGITSVVLVVFLAGCASTTHTTVPDVNELFSIHPDKARVFFYRENHFQGGGLNIDVGTGNEAIGTLKNGSYFVSYMNPGKYILTTSASGIQGDDYLIQLKPGETLTLKVGFYARCLWPYKPGISTDPISPNTAFRYIAVLKNDGASPPTWQSSQDNTSVPKQIVKHSESDCSL